MKLQRQLLISFISVALLPLIAISAYMYQTNVRLAFELYQENLSNSTEIQAGIINNDIRQFLVQSTRFVASKSISAYLTDLPSPAPQASKPMLDSPLISREILQFTDNTLDTVTMFALTDRNKKIMYASGSNKDGTMLARILNNIPLTDTQNIYEVPWDKNSSVLISATPVKSSTDKNITVGMLLAVYNNDYFLKSISNHKQLETSNSFIYCENHNIVIKSKHKISHQAASFSPYIKEQTSGTFTCSVDGAKSLNSFQHIANTPWILINTIPTRQVYSTVFFYAMVNLAVFALCLTAIILLSIWQSKRIIYPLNLLLHQVEQFFMSGGKSTSPGLMLDKRTEIGYLSDQFTHMASNITAAQAQLNEANYLYTSIIHATYDLLIRFHFDTEQVDTTDPQLSSWFDTISHMPMHQQIIQFFETTKAAPEDYPADTIRDIAGCKLTGPIELETCCRMISSQGSTCWYRIIVVPIIGEGNQTAKIVLHFEDITVKKLEELQLLETSQKDPLCGLLNKQAFIKLMQKHAASRTRRNAVFFIDLDNFKQVNDTLGHRIGDDVLINTSHVLTEIFRASDLVARYGGDEFIVFASGLTLVKAQQKAETILRGLDMHIDVPDQAPIHVTASVGVYITETVQEPEAMISMADTAMYHAKQNGKFQYYVLQNEEDLP